MELPDLGVMRTILQMINCLREEDMKMGRTAVEEARESVAIAIS